MERPKAPASPFESFNRLNGYLIVTYPSCDRARITIHIDLRVFCFRVELVVSRILAPRLPVNPGEDKCGSRRRTMCFLFEGPGLGFHWDWENQDGLRGNPPRAIANAVLSFDSLCLFARPSPHDRLLVRKG